MDSIEKIIENITTLPIDENIFLKAFCLIDRKKLSFEHPLNTLFLDDIELSFHIKDSIAIDGSTIRNLEKVRKIANFLIEDPQGILNEKRLDELIDLFEKWRYFLTPFHENETPIHDHILNNLHFLKKSSEAKAIIKYLSRPLNNELALLLIKETMNLQNGVNISDNDVKRAVIASLLCYFRQSVGSCFATAPAIIIQSEQPLLFLQDMKELIDTASLKRVVDGVQYVVPISPSSGHSTFKKPFFVTDPINPLTESSAFLIALEGAKIIDPEDGIENKKSIVKKLLTQSYPHFKPHYASIESFIKSLLLSRLELTEDDIKYYHEMKEDLLSQKIALEVDRKRDRKKSKSEKIGEYRQRMNGAKSAFKKMAENTLLRTWEYTLASFAESKPNFISWNLYSSLGLKNEEVEGIGPIVYKTLSDRIEQNQKMIENIQGEYERVYLEIKALESQAKNIESQSAASQVQAQYTIRRNEMEALLDRRDGLSEKNNHLSSFYNIFYDEVVKKFPVEFQEIYDADMQEGSIEAYDDTPAGFRLLYKHSRTNPLTWSLIYTPDDFINVLCQFFNSVETYFLREEKFNNLHEDIRVLFDAIIRHIRSKVFIESCFDRMSKAHHTTKIKNPLDNLEKISKKPWAYTSGGSLVHLLATLYKRDELPTEKTLWVENEMELLVFYSDLFKGISSKIMNSYQERPNKSMLAFSPTHAFILKPGFKPFINSWQSNQNSYTWVRDNFVYPMKEFSENIFLTESMCNKLKAELVKKVPIDFQNEFINSLKTLKGEMRLERFHEQLLSFLFESEQIKSLVRYFLPPDLIDSTLYNLMPLTPVSKIHSIIESMLEHFKIDKKLGSEFDSLWDYKNYPFDVITGEELKSVCKTVLLLKSHTVFFKTNIHNLLVEYLQQEKHLLPKPIILADSNWKNGYFGFAVNPINLELEFFKFDTTFSRAEPLYAWKKWLRGHDEKKWGVLIEPYQYGQ